MAALFPKKKEKRTSGHISVSESRLKNGVSPGTTELLGGLFVDELHICAC